MLQCWGSAAGEFLSVEGGKELDFWTNGVDSSDSIGKYIPQASSPSLPPLLLPPRFSLQWNDSRRTIPSRVSKGLVAGRNMNRLEVHSTIWPSTCGRRRRGWVSGNLHLSGDGGRRMQKRQRNIRPAYWPSHVEANTAHAPHGSYGPPPSDNYFPWPCTSG